MFPLAAIGSGLGQFAENYQRQQEMAKQSLMLRMQLANFQRQQDEDQRQSQAASMAFGFDPSALGGGTRPMQPFQPMQPMPGGGGGGGVSALTGPVPGLPQRPPSMGAAGEYGAGQSADIGWLNQNAPFATRASPQMPPLGGRRFDQPQLASSDQGPGAFGGAITPQLPANMPPPNQPPGMSPAQIQMGAPSQAGQGQAGTSPQEAASIAGSVAGGLGGAPAATATPQPPEPPPAPRDIALLLRQQHPNADSRTLIQAAQDIHTRLQADYKIQSDRWKAIQQIGGEAASRQETVRHDLVGEGQAGQRIEIEGAGQKETVQSHRAGETATSRQQTETERAHRAAEQNAAARIQATVGKEKSKVDLATTELDTLANEARQLAAMVEANPKLVGAKGIVGRLGGSIGEQLGILEEDPSIPQFKSKIQLLQSRLAKPLLSARYFSSPAQKRLESLLPGLARLDNPTTVIQSLNNVADQLESTSAATKAASGVVSHDVSKLTNEEIMRAIPAPGAE